MGVRDLKSKLKNIKINVLSTNFFKIVISAFIFCDGSSLFANYGYKTNEVIVKYRVGISRNKSTMEAFYNLAGVKEVKRLKGIFRGIEKLTLEDNQKVSETISNLKGNSIVEYIQPNYILKILPTPAHVVRGKKINAQFPCFLPGVLFPPGCEDWDIPSDGGEEKPVLGERPTEVYPPVEDPDLGKVYGLGKTGASAVWQTYRGNENFTVAIIDTGIDYNHEDLSLNVWRNPNPGEKNDVVGYDFVHDDGLPYDDNMHGTHCAGVIGAVGGNGIGISGMNQRVSIMALKFLDKEGSGDTMSAIQAIEYAISHGAKVMSNSWGGGSALDNQGLEDAIHKASLAGILFIAAAGNESNDNDANPTFPAAYRSPNMITVAATDDEDNLAFFSNTGKDSVHLAAPGVDIYSTVPGNRYKKLSGTSMACPHVAGAAALLWSAHPDWDYVQVKEALLSSVDSVDSLKDKMRTGGRLNIARAMGIF